MQGRCQRYLASPRFSGSSAVIGHQDPIIRTCQQGTEGHLSLCALAPQDTPRLTRASTVKSPSCLVVRNISKMGTSYLHPSFPEDSKNKYNEAQEKPMVSSGAGNGGGGYIGLLSESGSLSPQLPLSELPQSILAWVPSRTTSAGEPSTRSLSKENTLIIGKMSKPSSALF